MQIRILVVDDEKETGDYLQLLLTKAGYEVVALTDPTLVMDRLRAEDFHLVILDMMMPQMSGTELLEKIRGYDSDIAVIVATAHPAVETAVASLKAQASDYVKKPVEPEELLAAVESALAKKGLSKDPEAELHRAIGRTIREARKSQELTLKQLARRTGPVGVAAEPDRACRVERVDQLAVQDRLGVAAADGRAVRGRLTPTLSVGVNLRSVEPWDGRDTRPGRPGGGRALRRDSLWSRSLRAGPPGGGGAPPRPGGARRGVRHGLSPARAGRAARADRPAPRGWTPGRQEWTGSAARSRPGRWENVVLHRSPHRVARPCPRRPVDLIVSNNGLNNVPDLGRRPWRSAPGGASRRPAGLHRQPPGDDGSGFYDAFIQAVTQAGHPGW